MSADDLGADQVSADALFGFSDARFARQVAFDAGANGQRDGLLASIDVEGMQERLQGTIIASVGATALKIQLNKAVVASVNFPQALRDRSAAWLAIHG